MGDLSDAMQSLVDDIKSSAESRHVKISEMKSDTHNMLERFYLERQDMNDALRGELSSFRGKLSSDIATLKDSTQRLMSDVRAERQDMSDALRGELSSFRGKLSSDIAALKDVTQQFMSDVRAERQDMIDALRGKLSSDSATLRGVTQQFVNGLASDRGRAREMWRSFAGMVEEAAPESVAEEVVVAEAAPEPIAEEEETAEEAAPSPEDQIVEVVARHPEGIRLVDIGNELGVDWRTLIGSVKPLVDEGGVEKIDNLYYPKT